MKKWLIYVLGIITGVILSFVFAFCVIQSNKSGIDGLEMFDEPGEYMEFSQFRVFQVGESGCALADAGDSFGTIVLIVPNKNQQFYDDQKVILKNNQRAQRVGTFRYNTQMGIERTVPAIIIVDGVESPESDKTIMVDNSGKTLFEKPGDCVSRKNFKIHEVLESGDAIAFEIREAVGGYVYTSDLEVLILAQDGSDFYNNQIIKAPKGKCARQIGTYKYHPFGDEMTKVIPIVAFE